MLHTLQKLKLILTFGGVNIHVENVSIITINIFDLFILFLYFWLKAFSAKLNTKRSSLDDIKAIRKDFWVIFPTWRKGKPRLGPPMGSPTN